MKKNKRSLEDYVIISIFALGLWTLTFAFLKLCYWIDNLFIT